MWISLQSQSDLKMLIRPIDCIWSHDRPYKYPHKHQRMIFLIPKYCWYYNLLSSVTKKKKQVSFICFFLINHLFFLGASVFKFYSFTIYEGKNHRSLFKTPLYLFRFKRARLLLKRFYFSYNYCFAVLVLYALLKIKGGSFSNNKISNSKKTTEDEI